MALFGLWLGPAQAAAGFSPDATVRVLAVHAYSQAYPWTSGQHTGFVGHLGKNLKYPATIKTEYLDTKRKQLDEDYARNFSAFLRTKYADYAPDVIYVTDDNGLIFAVDYLADLFPDAAVFFSGVNDFHRLLRLDRLRFTGVFERKEIGPNLKLGALIPGDMQKIVFVGDGSATYLAIEREIKKQLASSGQSAVFVAENNISALRQALAAHRRALIVMTTLGAVRNELGDVLPLADTIAAIVAAEPRAVISMEDAYLFDGVLGGYVTSSVAQGQAAAAMVVDYIAGKTIADIPPLTESPNEYILDETILAGLGVALPPDIAAAAKLINVRPGLIARYQSVIVAALAVVSGSLIVTLVLYALTMTIKNRQLTNSAVKLAEQGSRLEESEEKYRSLFELSEDPMWLIVEDRFMMANAAAAREMGYSGVEELVDIHPSELSPEAQSDGENSFDKAGRLMAAAYDKGFLRFEWDHRRKNGEVFPVEVSLTRIPVDQQNALFCVWRNISGQKETQSQLSTAMATSEEANRAKSDFLANMSHELRTPLNAILGFSGLIRGQYFGPLGSEKYSEYVVDIHNSSEHLLALVNDILDLSAIESGKKTLVKEAITMREVVEDCAPIILGAAGDKKIGFETTLADDLPSLVADRRAVKQIVLNLLSNAVKFTPDGGRISLDVVVRNGHHVIRIDDTGIGVAAEKLNDLTDPFVRSVSDPLMAQEGTGLGLAIVKSLVELHRGKLQIESEEGRGTCVTVSLPSTA